MDWQTQESNRQRRAKMDKKTMKKAGKKVISAMDSAESMIAKKIN